MKGNMVTTGVPRQPPGEQFFVYIASPSIFIQDGALLGLCVCLGLPYCPHLQYAPLVPARSFTSDCY